MLRRGSQFGPSIDASGRRMSEISYHEVDGAKFKGPSMSIKLEGKPPFYLGIAEVASAHALDGAWSFELRSLSLSCDQKLSQCSSYLR